MAARTGHEKETSKGGEGPQLSPGITQRKKIQVVDTEDIRSSHLGYLGSRIGCGDDTGVEISGMDICPQR